VRPARLRACSACELASLMRPRQMDCRDLVALMAPFLRGFCRLATPLGFGLDITEPTSRCVYSSQSGSEYGRQHDGGA